MTQQRENNNCDVVAPQEKNVYNKAEGEFFSQHKKAFERMRLAQRQDPLTVRASEKKFVPYNMLYKRNHPFYPDWEEWPDITLRYHSERLKKLQAGINRAFRCYDVRDFDAYESWLIDEIYFQSSNIIVALEAVSDFRNDKFVIDPEVFKNSFNAPTTPFFRVGLCSCEESYHQVYEFPNIECDVSLLHKRAHILAYMWSWVWLMKPRKYLRKYYKRLERVILALDEKYLNQFTADLITDPDSYAKKGRNILVEMYKRATFDKLPAERFAQRVEFLKHFVQQQSGTSFQSTRGTVDRYDEMLELTSKLFRLDDSVMDHLTVPVQQGFGLPHNVTHSWDDNDLIKLRKLINETKVDFINSLKDSILDTTKSVLVMFIIASIVALLAKIAIGAGALLVYKLIHLICTFVCGTEDSVDIRNSFVTQQGEGAQEIVSIPILPRLITKYIINAPQELLQTVWNSNQTDKIMRRISYVGDTKIDRGLDRIMTWVRQVVNKTVRWFYRTFLGVEGPADLDGPDHAVNAWTFEVDDILKDYYQQTLTWSDSTWSVIYSLYARGNQFLRSSAYKVDHMRILKAVQQLSNLLEQFKKHNKDGQSIRNPPVVIYLHGDTGVGKSSMTYPLAVSILKEIFKKEKNNMDLAKNWKNLVYMRASEQEYWDAFANQLICLFDDFNQQKDSAANPSLELFEIIRAANCFPYPLHMADIAEKAVTAFTSKIIIVSSNKRKPDTASLNYPEALYRRFDVCIDVRRKPNFVPKLDSSGQEVFDPSWYEFDQYQMSTQSTVRGGISWQELVTEATEIYFKRKDYVGSIESYISSMFEEAPLQFGEGVSVTPTGEVVVQQMGDEFDSKPVEMPKGNVMSLEYYSRLLKGYTYNEKEWFYKRWCRKLRSWWSPTTMDKLKEAVDSLKERGLVRARQFRQWKEKYSFLDKMKTPLMLLLGGLAFIALFAGISKLISPNKNILSANEFTRKLYAPIYHSVRANSEAYTPIQIRAAKVEGYQMPVAKVAQVEAYTPIQIKPAKVEFGEVFEQGVKDLVASEILDSITRRNVYKMYESTHNQAIGHIFFLKGRIAVMPRHYLAAFEQSLRCDPDATVYFEAILLQRSFECKIKDLLKNCLSIESPEEGRKPVYSRDLLAVAVPAAIVHQDATPFFCNKSSLSFVDKTEVMLPVLIKNTQSKSDRAVLIVRYTSGRGAVKKFSDLHVMDNVGKQVLRIVRDTWEYDLDTQSTECGAPLLVRNTKIQPGKICGFHIAGIPGTGKGYSTPFYKEDIETILSQFDDKYTMSQNFTLELKDFPVGQCQVPDTAEFVRLGALEKAVSQPMVTKIRPSSIYGKIRPPITKPCALRPVFVNGEQFDPRAYRLSRLGNICVPQDSELIKNSEMALLDELSSVLAKEQNNFNNNLKAEYSFKEAVCGIDGELFINSIKRTTSPGFPFVQKGLTRSSIFGDGDEYDLDNPRAKALEERCKFIVQEAEKGVVLDHYFTDTLKDERKPILKAHKTRLFSACPLDYLIVCKQYFNGPVAMLQQVRNKTHVSVGTNAYSTDWGHIVRLLQNKSEDMIAGDFEGFDASQHSQLLEAAGEVIIQLSVRFLNANERQVKIMRVLMTSLFNSLHVSGQEVYQWTHSLPSGHYLTAIINSLFVNIAFGCIWQMAFDNKSYLFARKFWEECGIVAYGDDHIVSVPKFRLNLFNQLTIPNLFKRIGLSYTMEDKDAIANAPSRKIEEISYLKRGFRFDKKNARWLAPLSLDTILEMSMWLHDGVPDADAQTIVTLETALKELALHEPVFWNRWAPVLRREAQSLDHFTPYLFQDETVEVCLSQSFEM